MSVAVDAYYGAKAENTAAMDGGADKSMVWRLNRFGDLVGASEELRRVFELIQKAARVDVPVLIIGETGTGKELVAREIHQRGARKDRPFVAVNTGVLSSELIASELFGHVKGAFTGAVENKAGRFAEADEGTLFLDEIGTMEERTQIALLRALESGEIRPLGAKQDRKVNVRIIAATNENLNAAILTQHFREDLLHRLQVFSISLPPLRSHPEDIPLLVNYFLHMVANEFELSPRQIDDAALALLQSYPWPGNIRELKNVLAQAAVMADDSVIRVEHLPARVALASASAASNVPELSSDAEIANANSNARNGDSISLEMGGREGLFFPMGLSLEEVQKAYILRTLAHCSNNKTLAAKRLGVSRKTLYDKLLRWDNPRIGPNQTPSV